MVRPCSFFSSGLPNSLSASARLNPAICVCLHPGGQLVCRLDLAFDLRRQLRGQAKAQMHRGGQPVIQRTISRPNCCLDRGNHVSDHVFRRVMQHRRKLPLWLGTCANSPVQSLNQQRMLCHAIGEIPPCLTIPTRDKGQAMGDVLDLDIQGSRVPAGPACDQTASVAMRAPLSPCRVPFFRCRNTPSIRLRGFGKDPDFRRFDPRRSGGTRTIKPQRNPGGAAVLPDSRSLISGSQAATTP